MTATRGLLTATAFVEIPTGVALLASPGVPASLLLGAPLAASAAIAVARMAGAAVLSLGVACWLVRHDGESRPGRGVVVSMLGYNVGVGVVLTHASLGLSVTGVLLWPAVGLHTALAAWCIACMRRSPLQRTVLSAK
jgi:hypothetical protein